MTDERVLLGNDGFNRPVYAGDVVVDRNRRPYIATTVDSHYMGSRVALIPGKMASGYITLPFSTLFVITTPIDLFLALPPPPPTEEELAERERQRVEYQAQLERNRNDPIYQARERLRGRTRTLAYFRADHPYLYWLWRLFGVKPRNKDHWPDDPPDTIYD